MSTEKLSPMQQELLSRADSIFASISSAASTVGDYAKTQLPDIATQYIEFYRVYSSVLMLIFITVSILGAWLIISVAIKDKFKLGLDVVDEWVGSRILIAFLGAVLSLTSSIVIMVNLKEFTMVWFAPKIFLLQTITQMIKG